MLVPVSRIALYSNEEDVDFLSVHGVAEPFAEKSMSETFLCLRETGSQKINGVSPLEKQGRRLGGKICIKYSDHG